MHRTPLFCEPLESRCLLAAGPMPPLPVLVADLDGDGLRDVAVVRPDVESGTCVVQVYRGAPGGSFSGPATARLGLPGQSLQAVQGDAGPLLLVQGPSANGLLQAGPDGELSTLDEAFTGLGGAPRVSFEPWNAAPVAADLTGDGLPDLASLDEQGRVLVRVGLPGGKFLLPQLLGGGVHAGGLALVRSPEGARLAALRLDGGAPSIILFSRDAGEAGLAMASGPEVPPGTICLVSGDLNGDGRDDLATAGADGVVRVWLQRQDGAFAASADREVVVGSPVVLSAEGGELYAASLLTGKVGAPDGLPDGPASPALPLYLARAGGVVATGEVGAVRVEEGGVVQSLEVSSVGGVVIGTGWVAALDRNAGKVLVFVKDEGGVYRLKGSYYIGGGARGLTAMSAEAEAGGRTDLVVALRSGDVVRLEGRGRGQFFNAGRAGNEPTLVVADIDGDGQDDFVYSNRSLDRITVQTSRGGTSELWAGGDELAGGALLVDLNGDGILDLAVCNSTAGSVLIYPGLGGGKFGEEVNGGKGVSVAAGPVALAAANLGAQGVALFVVSQGADQVTVLHGAGRSSWPEEVLTTVGVGPRPASVLIQDLTGDGLEDLVVACSGSDSVWIVPGLGDGQFDVSGARVLPTGHVPTRVVTGDFDGDGRVDLVSVDSGGNGLTFYSDVAFAGPVGRHIWSGGEAPVAVLARDVNNDGISDLIVSTYADSQVSLLIGGGGGPAWQQSLSAQGMSSQSLAAGGATASSAFWVVDQNGSEKWLMRFGLESPSGQDVPSAPKEGDDFDLVPLERGAVPLVPLWRGAALAEPQAPVGNVLTALALLAPGCVHEGLIGRAGAGCRDLSAEDGRVGPMPPGPAAVHEFLLGAESAGPPALPPEVDEVVMPLDRVPPSGTQATAFEAAGGEQASPADEEGDEARAALAPEGDDHLAQVLVALALGGAVWFGTNRKPAGVASTR